MPPSRREAPPLDGVAAAGLGLVLVVVLASAAIRLSSASPGVLPFFDAAQLGALRVVHRSAASLEVLLALWLGWRLWRRRREAPAQAIAALFVVLALTALLSVIGVIGGRSPSAGLALANVIGGLALAAVFAWLRGALSDRAVTVAGVLALAVAAMLAMQSLIGARLSIGGHAGTALLPLHIFAGLVLAAILVALSRGRGKLLCLLAVAAPLAGFTALQYEYSGVAALVHAGAAAFLIAATAAMLGRNA